MIGALAIVAALAANNGDVLVVDPYRRTPPPIDVKRYSFDVIEPERRRRRPTRGRDLWKRFR